MSAGNVRKEFDSREDLTLVHAAKQGDMAAFEQLVNRYTKTVFRVAMHILDSREDAEDVVQEAFLKALEHLQGFEERSRFSTWVTRIAVNAALLRRHKARRSITISMEAEVHPGISLAETVRDWRPNPEQLFRGSEMRKILQRAVASLSDGCRVVFLLRDVEGLSVAEVADLLGISTSNTKVRLFRARFKLREYLSNYFEIGSAEKESLSPPKQCAIELRH